MITTNLKKTSVQSILALGVVAFVLTSCLLIIFSKIPAENKDYVMILIGFMLGSANSIINFYFGASKKQEMPGEMTTETTIQSKTLEKKTEGE